MIHTDTPQQQAKAPSTSQMVLQLKIEDQDFEFYPSTTQIIECVRLDIRKERGVSADENYHGSILDCGAGDGRVLKALTSGNMYAIERAKPLLKALDHNIFVVGTDFNQQTLLDKKVEIIYSNPPYSDFVAWTLKIIKEGNAPIAYLVIPERWQDNQDIADALESREASHEIIGEFDFLEADRKARAKVHVVRIDFSYKSRSFHSRGQLRVDPFKLWFDENFKIQATKSKVSDWNAEQRTKNKVSSEVESSNELVKDEGLVKVLVACTIS